MGFFNRKNKQANKQYTIINGIAGYSEFLENGIHTESEKIFANLRDNNYGNTRESLNQLVYYSRRVMSVSGLLDRFVSVVGDNIIDSEKPRAPLYFDGKSYADIDMAWQKFYFKNSFYSECGALISGAEFEREGFARLAIDGEFAIVEYKDSLRILPTIDATYTDNRLCFCNGEKYAPSKIISMVGWRDKSYPQFNTPIIAKALPYASAHAFISLHIASNNETSSKPIGIMERTAAGTMPAKQAFNRAVDGGLYDSAGDNSRADDSGENGNVKKLINSVFPKRSIINLMDNEKIMRFPAGMEEQLIKQQANLEELISQGVGMSRAALISNYQNYNFASLKVGDNRDANNSKSYVNHMYKNQRTPAFMWFVQKNYPTKHANVLASCPYWVANYTPSAEFLKDLQAYGLMKESGLGDEAEIDQKF